MKKLLLASFVALPSLALAGGIGGVSLGDYNIVPMGAMGSSSLMNSSEAPAVSSTRSTSSASSSERRRGYGFRLPTQATSKKTSQRRTGSNSYGNYWNWVNGQRATDNSTTGVTRTDSYNFGNSYELATGLEPIDPNDNTFRGLSREDERQSAAKLKMLRLRR